MGRRTQVRTVEKAFTAATALKFSRTLGDIQQSIHDCDVKIESLENRIQAYEQLIEAINITLRRLATAINDIDTHK